MEANTDNYFCDMGLCGIYAEGGTSYAAPRWAGFMALVNQQAVAMGQIPQGQGLGFINPTAYLIGKSSNYGSNFHDISVGSNNCSGAQFCGTTSYNAVSGYDLVTGWGSPNGQSLINALIEPPQPAPPAPPFLPTYYRCSGNVSNPQAPTLANGGDAEMYSGGGGMNNAAATCTYSSFTTSTYLTTAPMTLSFGYNTDHGAAGRATISVSLFGTVISGSQSGTYTATVPAGTDLSTLSVTGYAKVSSISGDEAWVDLGTIVVR